MLIRFWPCWTLAGLLAAAAGHAQSVQISDGKVFDRQASMAADGAVVLIVTERTTAPGSGLDGTLSLLRSTDGGQSFAIPAPTLFPQSALRHPTLIRWDGHWVLVFEEGIGNDPVMRLRRALSNDGQTFVRDPDPIALGWPAGGQRQPQLLDPGDGTVLLSYVHEGDSYLAVSTDGGAHFDTSRTRTATGAATARLAYRPADQRYVLAYASTDPLQRIGVRSTLDLRDWNDPTVWLTAADLDRESPWPVIQGSGQLAVVYAGLAPEDGRSDLYLRTSMDLIEFSSERPLTRGLHSETRPLAYAVPDPDRFGLIYSRSFSPCGSSYCWLFRDAGVLADTLLADGFDLSTP